MAATLILVTPYKARIEIHFKDGTNKEVCPSYAYRDENGVFHYHLNKLATKVTILEVEEALQSLDENLQHPKDRTALKNIAFHKRKHWYDANDIHWPATDQEKRSMHFEIQYMAGPKRISTRAPTAYTLPDFLRGVQYLSLTPHEQCVKPDEEYKTLADLSEFEFCLNVRAVHYLTIPKQYRHRRGEDLLALEARKFRLQSAKKYKNSAPRAYLNALIELYKLKLLIADKTINHLENAKLRVQNDESKDQEWKDKQLKDIESRLKKNMRNRNLFVKRVEEFTKLQEQERLKQPPESTAEETPTAEPVVLLLPEESPKIELSEEGPTDAIVEVTQAEPQDSAASGLTHSSTQELNASATTEVPEITPNDPTAEDEIPERIDPEIHNATLPPDHRQASPSPHREQPKEACYLNDSPQEYLVHINESNTEGGEKEDAPSHSLSLLYYNVMLCGLAGCAAVGGRKLINLINLDNQMTKTALQSLLNVSVISIPCIGNCYYFSAQLKSWYAQIRSATP